MCDNKLGCGNNFDQFAEVHDADEEIQTIVDQVKSDVEAKCERKFDQLKAVKYRMIMMDGIAYLIKAQVNQSDEYVHLRVVTPLGFDEGEEEKPVLTFVLTGKSLSDILFI